MSEKTMTSSRKNGPSKDTNAKEIAKENKENPGKVDYVNGIKRISY
jgi:hypothetical protein